jgi:hypothetical protein
MILERLKTVKAKVRALMLKNDRYKDDVKFMVSGFYWNYYPIQDMTALDFLKGLANGDYPNPDDVARIWRKLLENEPSLRGPNYVERQNKGDKMKTEIHDL